MDLVGPFVYLCVLFVDCLLFLDHLLGFQLCECCLVLLDLIVTWTFVVFFQRLVNVFLFFLLFL